MAKTLWSFGHSMCNRVKHCAVDLAVTGASLIPGGPNIFDCGQDSIAHTLSLLPAHCPEMTEILLKSCKIASYL